MMSSGERWRQNGKTPEFARDFAPPWLVRPRQVARVRLKAENDRGRQQVALLPEETRVKDARMNRIAPQRRHTGVLVQRVLRRPDSAVMSSCVSCYDVLRRTLEAEWQTTTIRPESRSPRGWPGRVKSATLRVISLAHHSQGGTLAS